MDYTVIRHVFIISSSSSYNSLSVFLQVTDLNRRMSAIEALLNRLEQKVTPTYDQVKPLKKTTFFLMVNITNSPQGILLTLTLYR